MLDENDEPLAYAYTIEGIRINTLTELDPDCRVMIVSSQPTYEGLRGLTSSSGEVSKAESAPP